MAFDNGYYQLITTGGKEERVFITERLPVAPLAPAQEGFQRRLDHTVQAFIKLASRCHVELDSKRLRETCRKIQEQRPSIKKTSSEEVSFPSRTSEIKNWYQFEIAPDGRIFIKIKEIGRGEFKKIYLGIDYNNARLVALSEIPQSQEMGDTFIHEQVAYEKIQDQEIPGLIKVYGVYSAKLGHRFLVSRYYCGHDLVKHIANESLSDVDKFIITVDLLRGIFFLHRMGLVHRDIKPENVLVSHTKDGKVVEIALTDFGSSSPINEDDRLHNYMADFRHRPPEIDLPMKKRKEGDYDYQLSYDIWSLGITLLRMYQNIGLKELPWEPCIAQKNFQQMGELKKQTTTWIDINLNNRIRQAIELMVKPEPGDRGSAESLLAQLTS